MKIKIERVNYRETRTDEFFTIYDEVIGICRKHDMSSLHVEKSFNELYSFQGPIKSLSVYLRKNEKLARAGQAAGERENLLRTLNRVVDGFGYMDIPEIRTHCDVLEKLLSKHNLPAIVKATRAAETERIQLLETEINANKEAQDAFAAFGLTIVVRRLFDVNREYEILFREYIAEKSEEQRIDVVQLKNECCKALTQFFDAIQYSAYVFENLNYLPLANEISKLNRYYIQQLSARATRRKNGKKTSEEPPIEPMKEGANPEVKNETSTKPTNS
jgi:hypothetical protein